MTWYTVSYEGDDHTGTYWFDVDAENTLSAVAGASAVIEDEHGTPGGAVQLVAYPVSVPVKLSPSEGGHCGVCEKPIPAGFSVCSREHAAEHNEANPDDRLGRHDYPSSKGGAWHVAWRASERGYRAVYLGRDVLWTEERGGNPYDEQRPLDYDDRLYPDEAPARARAEELNAA